MKILLLQLSDIHFWEGKHNPLNHSERIQEIVDAVQGIEAGVEACFILFNGDIAQSAQLEEYRMGEQFFDALMCGLWDARPEWRIESIFIPGNHDCVLPDNDALRQAAINEIFKDLHPPYRAQNSLVEFCLKAQDPFWEFEARRMGREAPLAGATRLFQSYTFDMQSYKIVFNCYNSAWLSRRKEGAGQLLMPLDVVPDAPECDLLVSLLHHPLNWIHPENAKAFRKALEHDSDFVMTGHEHESDGATKRTMEGGIVTISEGAVLQEHGNSRSGFVAHIVDFSRQEFRSAAYMRDTNPGRYVSKQETKWQTLERNPLRRTAHLNNTWEFARFLRDVGANYTHPAKANISLDDLFFYPDFDIHTQSTDDASTEIISSLASENVLSYVCDMQEVLFFGSERCGKSALGKKLYVDLQGSGWTPLLLSGEDITSTDASQLAKIVEKAITDQYGEKKLESFQLIHQNRKAVIVDDFHFASANSRDRASGRRMEGNTLNIKGQNAFIEVLRQHFDKIVLLADEVIQQQEFVRGGNETSLLSSFNQCEFREMGHRQCGQIIERWYTLGREHSTNEQDVSHQIRSVENLVATLVSRDLIPKRPIFVLILLQQHEANLTANTVKGAYGYYFQALITTALDKTIGDLPREVTRELPMDMLQTVLSHIAYRMFSLNKKTLSDEELEDAVEQYKNRHSVRFSFEHLKTILQRAKMLYRTLEGRHRFNYPYLGSYFVARYIADNLNTAARNTQMRELLNNIIAKLHVEDYSNVLVFFMYFTKDEKTIHDIVAVARSLYAQIEPCDLEKHIGFVNRLTGQPLQLRLGDETIRQNQEERRRKLDEAERTAKEEQRVNGNANLSSHDTWNAESAQSTSTAEADSDSHTYEESADEGSETESDLIRERREEREITDREQNRAQLFNLAVKTMQIMGQILRDFPGTLEGEPKKVIAQECELLGLRALRAQFAHAEENLDSYREIFSGIVLEMRPLAEDIRENQKDADMRKVAERTDDLLAHALMVNTYLSVKRISYSVGSEHLRETYEDVDASISPIAINLIHTSIKLDHFRDFPSEEVTSLNEQLQKNRFSRDILRMLVRDRFLLHPESHVLRQRICRHLNIRINNPKALAPVRKKLT